MVRALNGRQEDAKGVAGSLICFCRKGLDVEELLRLTCCFLLNSFAAESEVRLCRFCALLNHSCHVETKVEEDFAQVSRWRPPRLKVDMWACGW